LGFFPESLITSSAHNVDINLLDGISKGQTGLKMRHSFSDTSVGFFSEHRKMRFQG